MYKCSKCGSDNCSVLYMPVGKMLSEDQVMVPKLNDYVKVSQEGTFVKKEFLLCSCGVCTFQFVKDVLNPNKKTEEELREELQKMAEDITKDVEKEIKKMTYSISEAIGSFHKKYNFYFNIDK